MAVADYKRQELKTFEQITELKAELRSMIDDITVSDGVIITKREKLRLLYISSRQLRRTLDTKMMAVWNKYNDEHNTYCSLEQFGEYIKSVIECDAVIGNETHGDIYRIIRESE